MNKRSYVGDVRFNYFNNYGELELFYIFQKEENQRNIAKTYVSIFVNLKPFCLLCIYGSYIWHDMLAQPYTFVEIFY